MAKWFRLPNEIINEVPYLRMSPATRWHYIALLCVAAKQDTPGTLPSMRVMGFYLRVNKSKLSRLLNGFIESGMIHSDPSTGVLSIPDWNARYGSPPSALRPSAEKWSTLRSEVFLRDDYTCHYCGERGKKLECDHVIPVSRGGSNALDNLVTACFSCNRSKRDKMVEEWSR